MTLRAPSPRTVAVLKVLFVVAGFTFLAWSVVDAWRKADGNLLPSAGAIVVAGLLWAAGLTAALFGWLALVDQRHRALVRGFFVSQIGKYVPGAVWQGLGLVKSADDAGVGAVRSGPAYGAYVVTQVAAAAPVALVLVVAPGVDFWIRVAAVAGSLSLLVLDRRWMVFALARIPKLRDVAGIELPPQRRILEAWVANSASLLFSALAFWVLLGDVTGSAPGRAVGAFAVAWLVGFVIAPVPAGLGLREVVLLLLLRKEFDRDLIVTVSAYHRIVILGVEALLVIVALAWPRGPRSRPEPLSSGR